MLALLDNLGAMIVATSVFLVLLSLQARTSQMSIEQTSTYVVKRQAADMATWMEEDLLQLGRNIDPLIEVPFENPVDSGVVTTDFTFYRDSIATDGSVIRITTRYDVKRVGTRVLGGDSVDVYRLDRWVQEGTSTAWVQEGGSGSLLSSFEIDMLNRDAMPVSDPKLVASVVPDSVRNTRVRFSMVTPFDTRRSTVRQIYYGSTLMIAN